MKRIEENKRDENIKEDKERDYKLEGKFTLEKRREGRKEEKEREGGMQCSGRWEQGRRQHPEQSGEGEEIE